MIRTEEEIQKEIEAYTERNKRSFEIGFKAGYNTAIEDLKGENAYMERCLESEQRQVKFLEGQVEKYEKMISKIIDSPLNKSQP